MTAPPTPPPSPQPSPKATQKEVAAQAGVSQTVVSQVLNGQAARIHPETRARVQEAIQTLGYVPNAAARRLVGGASSLIGVFTYEAVFPSSTRDFYAPFLEGIEEAAAGAGLDLLLYTSGTRQARRSLASTVARRSLTDGTILLGNPGEAERAELADVVRSGHRAVFIGRRELPGVALPCVQADYAAATADLTRRFADLGHAALLYVGSTLDSESTIDRERGFLGAGVGARRRVQRLEASALTPDWLTAQLAQGISGFLVENDTLMRRLLEVAAAQGLSCPQHFSAGVLGDDISGQAPAPHWTRFGIPRQEMGRGAIRLLGGAQAGQHPPTLILPCATLPGQTLGEAHARP